MTTQSLVPSKYNLPIPNREIWNRRILNGALITVGVLAAGGVAAMVTPALWSLYEAGKAAIAAGLVFGGIFSAGALVMWAKPHIQKQFALWGYQMSAWQRTNYPMEVLGLRYQFLQDKYNRSLVTAQRLGGKKKKLEDRIAACDKVITDAAMVSRDLKADITSAVREEMEDQVSQAQQSKVAYSGLLARITPALETVNMLTEVARRQVRKFRNIMGTTLIKKEVGDLALEVNGELRQFFGENQSRADAEAVIQMIDDQMGQTFGEMEILELQARQFLDEGKLSDEIALSQARQAMMDRMRIIDGEARVIPEPAMMMGTLGQERAKVRLLDR